MIVGGGKLGLYLGKLLSKEKIETTIVEISKSRCYKLMEQLPESMIINADGTDFNVLQEEMLKRVRCFRLRYGNRRDKFINGSCRKTVWYVQISC